MRTKPRDRWEIILDILEVISEKGREVKTNIIERANLDWRNSKGYFDSLLKNGFIEKKGAGKTFYKITKKGKKFKRDIQKVEEYLKERQEEPKKNRKNYGNIIN